MNGPNGSEIGIQATECIKNHQKFQNAYKSTDEEMTVTVTCVTKKSILTPNNFRLDVRVLKTDHHVPRCDKKKENCFLVFEKDAVGLCVPQSTQRRRRK